MARENPLQASLEILAEEVKPGDEVGYRITNTGGVDLICGLPYRLERDTGAGWAHVNRGMAFRLIGFGVGPGESRDLVATVPANAGAGLYRISTSVHCDALKSSVRVSAQFCVQSSS